MARRIQSADWVLVVCTPTYEARVMGCEEPGKCLGAAWKGGIITQEI